jgi:uncharacterized membrane protein (UPF0127 family)
MSWLLRDGDVLASLEEARGASGRARGLLGRDGFEGALLLRPARSVHTIGMRFPIDVAYLDGDLRVVAMTRMRPWRIGLPRVHARCVVEAEAGAFERWKLTVGDELEIR